MGLKQEREGELNERLKLCETFCPSLSRQASGGLLTEKLRHSVISDDRQGQRSSESADQKWVWHYILHRDGEISKLTYLSELSAKFRHSVCCIESQVWGNLIRQGKGYGGYNALPNCNKYNSTKHHFLVLMVSQAHLQATHTKTMWGQLLSASQHLEAQWDIKRNPNDEGQNPLETSLSTGIVANEVM